MNIELKDYFASKAMQALLSSEIQLSIDDIITTSYDIAQKMLEHKNKLINKNYINNSNQINTEIF